MYDADLVRVHRLVRRVTDFPRARLEYLPMTESRRFKLTIRSDNFALGTDGSLHVWIDRGDACNLQLDCSGALLDADIDVGSVKIKDLIG